MATGPGSTGLDFDPERARHVPSGAQESLTVSPLGQRVTRDATAVEVEIYGDGKGAWLLEVVDEFGNSTVWDDPFPTDSAALAEALNVIDSEGIAAVIGRRQSARRAIDWGYAGARQPYSLMAAVAAARRLDRTQDRVCLDDPKRLAKRHTSMEPPPFARVPHPVDTEMVPSHAVNTGEGHIELLVAIMLHARSAAQHETISPRPPMRHGCRPCNSIRSV